MKSLLSLIFPAVRTRLVGSVDSIHRGQVRGWAMDLDQPTARLTVRMVDASGRTIVRTLADRYRADVQKAGYADGYYGFALPAADPDIVETARFLCDGKDAELPRTNAGRRRSPITFRRDDYVLCLDPATAGALTGWAVDRQNPGQRRLVRLRAGRKSLTVQRATLYRRDSIDGGSDGFHGFSLPPPPARSGGVFVDDLAAGLEFRIF